MNKVEKNLILSLEKVHSRVDILIKVLCHVRGKGEILNFKLGSLSPCFISKLMEAESVDVAGNEVKIEGEESQDKLIQTISTGQTKTPTSPEKSSQNRQAYKLLVDDI
ncbi:hypothetical protein [Priestia endophytica]|uniref:hypothetical protein n=1 Tax=Priestia endophytica TaxID=135735 RepID=UPI00228051BF|nr:hypothetical protein [Priestia endophytica]MCY8233013.1 hypothetical protein [Priestia endophytica]